MSKRWKWRSAGIIIEENDTENILYFHAESTKITDILES